MAAVIPALARFRDRASGSPERCNRCRAFRAVPGSSGILAMALVAGCMSSAPRGEVWDPGLTEWSGVVAAGSVLLRGRILPADLILEPVFQVDALPSLPGEEESEHRLRGWDEAGEVLFDLRFDGTEVAGPPGVREEHFTFVVPLGPGGPLRLERVELESADGRRTLRTAGLTPQELIRAMEREDVVAVWPVGHEHVRVRWNAELFPSIMVRDAETGTILSFARGGEVTVLTEVRLLEVIVSDGVRSLARSFQTR